MAQFDAVWTNAKLATMTAGGAAYGAIEDGAIAVRDGRIAWVGRRADLPEKTRATHDLGGAWVTPGLIDCHTHLVFGGDRAGEFEQRLKGATYEEIARAGGGIRSTVARTRAASEDELLKSASRRLESLLAEGVTTIEIKSGYGLDIETEMKMLRAARRLGEVYPVTVQTTFLGAHAVPAEFHGRQSDYIDIVAGPMLDAVVKERLADAVDVFVERIAFSREEAARVFRAAQAHGLPLKLHADQLSDQNGAALAARFGALSAEHLEHANEDGVAAMGRAGTVAVLLPGAFYFLRDSKPPPIDMFRRHRVPIAIASDCNPGSSPALSLLLMLNMACTMFRLTPEEALAGVTRNAARALGLDDRGTLEPGKVADFVAWDISHPAELSYWIGANPARTVIRGGAANEKSL
ncbi:MAG TPA: imidazolonepropionase [Alphaproteobacteria bacterium]|nr:imidazolonepropionase [Alphaproteobacteria bacterium]